MNITNEIIVLVPGVYFNGMTSNGLNVLDHMYMAEVVAMILVTAMTIQVNAVSM